MHGKRNAPKIRVRVYKMYEGERTDGSKYASYLFCHDRGCKSFILGNEQNPHRSELLRRASQSFKGFFHYGGTIVEPSREPDYLLKVRT